MWALVALVALLVGAAGLISVVIPLRFLRIRTRPQGLALVVAAFIGLVVAGLQMDHPPSPPQTSKEAIPVTAQPAVVQPAKAVVETPVPADQAKFVKIVEDARTKYREEQTDFRKGATRPERAKALCGAQRSSTIADWIGTVDELTTNGDGKGVVEVRISSHIILKTWNNSFSDVLDHTLIEPSSSVFAQLAELRKKDRVKFSGRLLSGEPDCFREASATLSGSMTDPEFLLQFRRIEKF